MTGLVLAFAGWAIAYLTRPAAADVKRGDTECTRVKIGTTRSTFNRLDTCTCIDLGQDYANGVKSSWRKTAENSLGQGTDMVLKFGLQVRDGLTACLRDLETARYTATKSFKHREKRHGC